MMRVRAVFHAMAFALLAFEAVALWTIWDLAITHWVLILALAVITTISVLIWRAGDELDLEAGS